MFPPRKHPECEQLDPDAESITELSAILRSRVGRSTLLDARFPFVARIDSVQIHETGFRFRATPLASVQRFQPLLYQPSRFPWGSTWNGLIGGHGWISAPRVNWRCYYNEELTRAVIALVEAAAAESDNREALQLIEDFERRRNADRERFRTGELFTDRKLP